MAVKPTNANNQVSKRDISTSKILTKFEKLKISAQPQNNLQIFILSVIAIFCSKKFIEKLLDNYEAKTTNKYKHVIPKTQEVKDKEELEKRLIQKSKDIAQKILGTSKTSKEQTSELLEHVNNIIIHPCHYDNDEITIACGFIEMKFTTDEFLPSIIGIYYDNLGKQERPGLIKDLIARLESMQPQNGETMSRANQLIASLKKGIHEEHLSQDYSLKFYK